MRLSRRDVLGGGAVLAGTVFAQPLRAATPLPSAVTPELVEAARNEGKVTFCGVDPAEHQKNPIDRNHGIYRERDSQGVEK
jgi:hypothetical protein